MKWEIIAAMKALAFITLLAISIFTEVGRAGPLDNWSVIKPSQKGIALDAITYGNGQFVAVGYPGAILTSVDGVNWVQRQSGTTNALTGLAFANGQFVVVGKRRTILTSSNGVDWVERQTETQNYYYGYGIAYGNAKFVAVGDAIITSPDGTNWVERSLWDIGWGKAVAYGNGKFVAVGLDPPIQTSPDGLNWAQHQTGTQSQFQGITHGNDQFVAVGFDGIQTSADGINWVQRQSGALRSIAFANGQFVAVGDHGTILTSTDAINWAKRQSQLGTDSVLAGITYGNAQFVAVGLRYTGTTEGFESVIVQSGNIITLAIKPNIANGLLTLSLAGPTGSSYVIETSTDLISWRNFTNITSGQPTNFILEAPPAASGRMFFRAYSQ